MSKIHAIRHGISEGNIDRSVYSHTPDYAVRLTQEGYNQAVERGKSIGRLGFMDLFIVSPYYRTRDTMQGIQEGLINVGGVENTPRVIYDSRIREQEWGGLRQIDEVLDWENQRAEYGHYFYRFENGESCSDVELRLRTMMDIFTNSNFDNIYLVTHGMTMRVLAKILLNSTTEEFESWRNPKNCDMITFKQNHYGWNLFNLTTPFKTYPKVNCKFPYTKRF